MYHAHPVTEAVAALLVLAGISCLARAGLRRRRGPSRVFTRVGAALGATVLALAMGASVITAPASAAGCGGSNVTGVGGVSIAVPGVCSSPQVKSPTQQIKLPQVKLPTPQLKLPVKLPTPQLKLPVKLPTLQLKLPTNIKVPTKQQTTLPTQTKVPATKQIKLPTQTKLPATKQAKLPKPIQSSPKPQLKLPTQVNPPSTKQSKPPQVDLPTTTPQVKLPQITQPRQQTQSPPLILPKNIDQCLITPNASGCSTTPQNCQLTAALQQAQDQQAAVELYQQFLMKNLLEQAGLNAASALANQQASGKQNNTPQNIADFIKNAALTPGDVTTAAAQAADDLQNAQGEASSAGSTCTQDNNGQDNQTAAAKKDNKPKKKDPGSSKGHGGIDHKKPAWLPAWKKLMIDWTEIVTGHMEGGQRVVTLPDGTLNKDVFPAWMTEKDVQNVVEQAYGRSSVIENTVQDGAHKVQLEGLSDDGLQIHMWLNLDTGTLETAYPQYPGQ